MSVDQSTNPEPTSVTRNSAVHFVWTLVSRLCGLVREQLFAFYFNRIVPLIGGVISGDFGAYKYLPQSLAAFLPAEPLRQAMLKAGYRDVRYRLLGLGTMAIHVGVA